MTALLVVGPLAGCIEDLNTLDDLPAECSFVLPAARGGDQYLYAAEGTLKLQLQSQGVVVDWRAVGESAETNGPLQLPVGSQLAIAVASQATPRLGIGGSPESAFQASHWAKRPDFRRSIAFLDEWVSTTNGDLLQSNQRANFVVEGDVMHQIALWKLGRPPLLFAPLYWGHEMQPGIAETIGFRWFWDSRNETFFEHSVKRTFVDEGICNAEAEITFLDDPYRFRVSLVFKEGVALPVAYTEVYDDRLIADTPYSLKSPSLRLVDASGGNGPNLPPFVSRGTPQEGLRMVPSQQNFLSGTGSVFPTSFEEAVNAMKADATVGSWLESHPDALPSKAVHEMGAPGSSIIDRWDVWWAASNDESLLGRVTLERPIPLVPHDRMVVTPIPSGALPYPPVHAEVPLFSELVRIHRLVYGSAPEVLSCDLAISFCNVGTHAGTHQPHACERSCGAALILTGLRVQIDLGRVPVESSYDGDALHPAVASSFFLR